MTDLTFGLLGPVVVESGGQDLPVRGAVRRRLLVRLLVAANRPVPVERLRDDLWDGSPPESASSTLKSHVSLLRRQLGSDRLQHRDGAYVLSLAADELDAALFETEVASGRELARAADPGGAAAWLGQALARWRGPALLDARDSAWARPEAVRLEELRASALESWLEARLALGETHSVVADGEAAVADHPLREGLWAKVITALYRSGRQAEALRAYQRLRQLLADELGIAPSPELAALEGAILRQDLAPPEPARRPAIAPTDRSHLPAELSSFVPRPRELGEVRRLLRTSALVSLVGPGGTGKTRLALRAASEEADAFDGIWLCELAPVTDPSMVLSEVASVVGCADQPGVPLLHTLAQRLGEGTNILVLDNCEHLLDEAARLVGHLRATVPQVRLLVTSRSPLSTDGETIFWVPSMSVPAGAAGPASIADFEAVQLFVQRATSQQPSFRLDEDNARLVASICARLDGLPLAIELAAARLRNMALADIDQGLDDRFHLLTGGSRTNPRRQKSLQGLIDWSYDLLTNAQRRVFRRLSVFPGSFDLAAAEALLGDDRSDVLDQVSSLVDMSLLQADVTGRRTRYRMLETVRAYASGRLTPEEVDRVRAAHAGHFLDLVEEAAPHFSDSSQRAWRLRLDADDDNLRAAFATLTAASDPGPALRFGAAVSRYWNSRGFYGDEIAPLEEALDRPDAADPTEERGVALAAAGYLLFRRGDAAKAHRRLEEALQIGRSRSAPSIVAEALRTEAWLADRRGDRRTARSLAEGAVEHALLTKEHHLIARAYEVRAAAAQADDPKAARDDYDEALRVCRATGDQLGLATTLNNLAVLELEQDREEAARAHFREALTIAKDVEDAALIPFLEYGVGLTVLLGEDQAGAGAAFARTFEGARRTGQGILEAYALLGLGLATAASGSASRAAMLFGASAARFEELGEAPEPTEAKLRVRALATLELELADDLEGNLAAGRRLTRTDLVKLADGRL